MGKISATVNGTLKLYIQNDRLGSGRFASDASGVRVAHTYLDMWGYVYSQEKAEFGGKTINILDNFTNHDYDEILGIYYANARFYDPVMMRFLASDPARDGLNWYTYADGNPLRFVDPTGLVNVMLDYILDKNDGGISSHSWIYMPIFTSITWGHKYTVTIGETTKIYTGDQVKRIDGKLIIDHQILMDDFGLTEEQATHRVGDKFKTIDDTALAWALTYFPLSNCSVKENRKEYGSAIYLNGEDEYSYTEPNTSPPGQQDNVSIDKAPIEFETVAYIHSHPDLGYKYAPEEFSKYRTDKITNRRFVYGDLAAAVSRRVPEYIATPSGKIRRLEVTDRRDPNNPRYKESTVFSGFKNAFK